MDDSRRAESRIRARKSARSRYLAVQNRWSAVRESIWSGLERAKVGLNRQRRVRMVAPPGASRRAMRDIGQAAQRSGRPSQLDPEGRRLSPSGGVEDLAGSPATGCSLLLPARRNPAAL